MADQIVTSILEGRNIKFVDNGDGTFSLATSATGGGGGAVTIADGADIALGDTTDAAIVTDTTGTISGKLRGLVKWAFERMPASLGTKTAANSFPITPSSDGIFLTKPFDTILPYNATLVNINDQVDASEYGASVQMALGGSYSGEILNFSLLSQESGTGSVQTPQCIVYFFTSDPTISAGATAIDVNDWGACFASVAIATADWVGDANGKFAFKTVAISFEVTTSIYAVLFNQGSSINDAAGDDEIITISMNLRRDS